MYDEDFGHTATSTHAVEVRCMALHAARERPRLCLRVAGGYGSYAIRHTPYAMRHAPCAMRHAPCATCHSPKTCAMRYLPWLHAMRMRPDAIGPQATGQVP